MFGGILGGEKPAPANDDLLVDEIGRPIEGGEEESIPAPSPEPTQPEKTEPKELEEWIDGEPPVQSE